MTQFSIIVPTLNESQNIDLLLTRLFSLDLAPDSFEVVFVDDGSTDGTPEKIRAWKDRANVRLIERHENPDLTASILTGVACATSEVIVVMDADLSHPPERLRAVIKPILDGNYDVAIGSRYKSGGSTENWPWYREWLSRAGGWLACPICDVSDVTSGFFAFRRELIKLIPENARGYKILLELVMAGQGKFRVIEIPICFSNRIHGSSKLTFSHQWIYLQRLMSLAGGTVTADTASRFALIGLFGVLIDALLFQWMISHGAGLAAAHILSFFAAATVNYLLNSQWAFRQHHADDLQWHQFGRFLAVGVLALLLRGGVLAFLVYVWHIPTLLAIFPAILVTAGVNYFGSAFYVFPNVKHIPPLEIRWRVASFGIVTFVILLRLVYLGQAQLLPDEAYYWNYAQHMDLSFFDHPPMVAWLIWLGTSVMGQNEFGVRIGAFLCGLIAMGYLYALTRNLYDKSTGMRAVLLLSILPLGFASSMLMTTDAPVVAAWAASLYYMERALVADRSTAWPGMGIAFGLGLLSKYTLGLLGLAALIFVILDPTARRWMKRPHPYFAAALALVLFSPVIIWNFENNWVSFLFQSTRLLEDEYHFSVHHLILHLMILLTPVGFFAAMLALFSNENITENNLYKRKQRLFIRVFTGVPLAIFFILSTFDLPRFHWTGPIWLAILPTIAWMMGQTGQLRSMANRLSAAWQPTIIACLFIYAFVLHYVVLGIPGLSYKALPEHYFWRETTAEVEQIAKEIKHQTGKEPIVVGMSKWSVASELYFYNSSSHPMDIRSRNLFGDSGAMFDFWFPSQPPTTRPIILIGRKRHQLEHDRQRNDLDQMLLQPGPVQYRIIMRDGIPLRRIYYRVAQGYRGIPLSVSASHKNNRIAD
ncbi:MAG: glycosyltransferase family 39 protein [Nitrosomonas sp.]|nr:glycosyltransferase family 39 protein [Nitrosomonas sp.]MDP1950389.1 glycosyltransferase family 39 protein [Nitrosomonas sp.]